MSPTGHSCRPRRASRSETRKHQDLTRRHGQNPRFRSCQGGPARVRRNRPRRFSYAKPQKTPSCCLVRCPFAINCKFSGFLQSIAILPPNRKTLYPQSTTGRHTFLFVHPTLSLQRENIRSPKSGHTCSILQRGVDSLKFRTSPVSHELIGNFREFSRIAYRRGMPE